MIRVVFISTGKSEVFVKLALNIIQLLKWKERYTKSLSIYTMYKDRENLLKKVHVPQRIYRVM